MQYIRSGTFFELGEMPISSTEAATEFLVVVLLARLADLELEG